MIFLGIDPSTVSTGWAILDDGVLIECGAIRPKKNLNEQGKIKYIYDEIRQILIKYNPLKIACEDQFSRLNPKTLKILSRLVGAIILACEQHGVEAMLIPPTKVKLVFAGTGKATKEDMINEAKLYTSRLLCSDEADAIGIAVTLMEELKCDSN